MVVASAAMENGQPSFTALTAAAARAANLSFAASMRASGPGPEARSTTPASDVVSETSVVSGGGSPRNSRVSTTPLLTRSVARVTINTVGSFFG